MLVKDYYKIFMGKIIFVDMDNKTTKTVEATFENVCKYENHTIKAIEAGTRTQHRDIDNSVLVEPVICLYVMNENIKELYEVEVGRIDENNIEFGFKFTSFETYEEAKKYYDNYKIIDEKTAYKTLFKLKMKDNEEQERDIIEEMKEGAENE